MKISVFGLGYVGCVSLGCLAKDGHTVIGVDINEEKVNLINQGKPTIIEKDIDAIIAEQHRQGNIKATTDHKKAILATDITMICVGTPSTANGHANVNHVFDVAVQLGEALKEKNSFHTIVIRSTVPPNTNYRVGEIIFRVSDKKRNYYFGIVTNPEFMREGSAVDDYYNPSMTILGSDNDRSLEIVKDLYKNINAPIMETDIKVAEMIKYVNNSFHALKITFANEIGNISKKLDIDPFKVMDLFCTDDKLNISSSYLKPGFAYGGSCLPKDLQALKTLIHDKYLTSPVIESIEKSNQNQKEIAFRLVTSKGKKKIGVIGLSFKPGTDDLRYSPTVDLVERLLGKGYRIKIYDKDVYVAKLTGTNKVYIEEHIPHIAKLITDHLNTVIAESDVVVISHAYKEVVSVLQKYPEKIIIDLTGLKNCASFKNYEGICW